MLTSIATKRAVGYLRVSSVGQTGERHSSLETQEARFNLMITASGLVCSQLLPLSILSLGVGMIGRSTTAC